jgi:2-iminobutanoate/2-iminopropanoate deaminase
MNRSVLGRTAKPYSQGLKITGCKSIIFISGQIARDENDVVFFPGDLEQQARYIFESIDKLLAQAGAAMSDVVKIVAFVTTLDGYASYSKVRRDVFGDMLPVSSTVQVTSLVTPGCVIEIEAVALL